MTAHNLTTCPNRAVIDRPYNRNTISAMRQGTLFDTPQNLPDGFVYQPDFITQEEETALLAEISGLPLHEAKYKEYTAKRRIISYGGTYDFSSNELPPAGPIPAFLSPLRERI